MSRRRGFKSLALVSVVLGLLLAGCGGGDDNPLGSRGVSADDFADFAEDEGGAEGFADALGSGGGGTLVFDGEEIAIDSAVCWTDGELFDVGTVSANNARVLLSWTNDQSPVSLQILDEEFTQWFPTGEAVFERDGKVFSSPTLTYWNNADDREVEASFTVECP